MIRYTGDGPSESCRVLALSCDHPGSAGGRELLPRLGRRNVGSVAPVRSSSTSAFAESGRDRSRFVLIGRHSPMEQFFAYGALLPTEPVHRRELPGTPMTQVVERLTLTSSLSDLPGVIA